MIKVSNEMNKSAANQYNMVVKLGGYDANEAYNGIKVLKTINDANRNPTWGLLAKDLYFAGVKYSNAKYP